MSPALYSELVVGDYQKMHEGEAVRYSSSSFFFVFSKRCMYVCVSYQVKCSFIFVLGNEVKCCVVFFQRIVYECYRAKRTDCRLSSLRYRMFFQPLCEHCWKLARNKGINKYIVFLLSNRQAAMSPRMQLATEFCNPAYQLVIMGADEPKLDVNS